MSFHFSQVLGPDKPKTSAGAAPPKPEFKIETSDLQRRRAGKRTRASGAQPFISSFLSSSRTVNNGLTAAATSSSSLMKNHPVAGKVSTPPLSSSSPLSFASANIEAAITKDNSTPTLYEILSKYAVDSYNYRPNESLGVFTRFEKSSIFHIPDRIFQKYNTFDCITNMGLFTELERVWLTVDDKLIIWDYKGSSSEQEFYTIDEFKSTILTLALVKPRAKVFVDSVKYLLLVSTSTDIHILAVQKNGTNIEFLDTKMSVPTRGLIVNKFACYDTTGEIFFTGAGDSEGIWKLNYTNEDDWFSRNCTKECLTKSSLSSVLPSVLQSLPGFISAPAAAKSNVETVIELKIDQSRAILYTLSSKSIIQVFRLKSSGGKATLGSKLTKRPFDLLKELSTTTINMGTPLLARNNMKVVSIFPVCKQENSNLFLVAVTDTGCRIYLNGSTLYGDRLTLTASHVKFPPPDAQFYENLQKRKQQMALQEQNFIDNGGVADLTKSSITKNPIGSLVTVQDLKQAQESSKILAGLSNTLIISPGIFVGYTSEKGLFVSAPDYGILKNSSQYTEDFEFIAQLGKIHSIVQLTPSFNATDKPAGYCNEFASQYFSSPLEFAVLTGTGIHVFRYRTPDLVLEDSLDDKTFAEFSRKYGSEEACSSALYLACKYGRSDNFRNSATRYYISGGRNTRLIKRSQPTIDDVELSDRFVALVVLVSRLVREFWDKEVFTLKPEVVFTRLGYIDVESVKKMKTGKNILKSLSISKPQLEYFLCSILVLVKYFNENQKSIPGLMNGVSPPQIDSTSWKEKESEVCLQAEQIGFNAMLKFLNTVKEGLSFLTILLDDDPSSKNFEGLTSYLSLQSQADLSCLTFSEFFCSSDPYVSRLIKDILSAVINKSIASGNSVELVANTLQEKCGTFCSTGDVLIFKAVESLKKAKDFAGKNDQEMKMNYLRAAVKLLNETSDSLTEETITDCVNIMLQLEYYDGAIEFLLDMANAPEKASKPKDSKAENARRLSLYELVFQILADIDKKAILSLEQATTENTTSVSVAAFVNRDGQIITQYSQMRDRCYAACFNYKDKKFHYEFYKWFIANGVGEKLLDIDTPYILDFLKDNSTKDLEMAKLLWVYYSRREHYYEAASVLYGLATSSFDVPLASRIEFLSRANGFCHCIPPQSLRQEVVALTSEIEDLMAVSSLQDELLLSIMEDSRINEAAQKNAIAQLNGRMLMISDLYNDFIDPLGYYELGLLTFKISDYRNTEDILTKWESLFGKWYFEYKSRDITGEPFYVSMAGKFVAIASRLNDTDVLFPIMDIMQLMAKHVYSDEFNGGVKAPTGVIVDSFAKSGVGYGRLYYSLRGILESTTFEVFDGYSAVLADEMRYLIQLWYKKDKKLREIISDKSIRDFTYTVKTDPIYSYIKSTGNPL